MYIYMSVSRYMYIIHFHLSICIKYLARQQHDGGGERAGELDESKSTSYQVYNSLIII